MTLPESAPQAQALIQAIQTGDVSALALCLKQVDALSFRYVDTHGTHKSLLHAATDWPGHWPGLVQSIGLLVEAGADVNARASKPDGEGASETPLHWAASSDDVLAIDTLIQHGADVEATGAVFTGGTPMSDAVIFRKWAAAQALLSHGAQLTAWQAAGVGSLSRMESLLGGTEQQERNVALWHACRSGHADCVARLLELGAEPDWLGPMGWTPRRAAQELGDARVLELLNGR